MCNQKWWAPLFFLASIYEARVDKECLSWLWIISNEVIFFVLLVGIFYAYKKRPLYGYLTAILLIASSIICTLVEGLYYKFTYKTQKSMELDAIMYIHPNNACQGYLMGVILALVWFSYRNQGDERHRLEFVVKLFHKIQDSKILRLSIILTGIFLMLACVYLPFPIYQMDGGWAKIILSSIYVAIERTYISIGLCVFLLPSLVGKSGVLKVLLGNRLFVPLARLTTSALLIHGVILMWYFFGKYQTISLDPKVINCSFIALTMLSYLGAVFFTLMFESPFITMENLLLCPHKKKKYCGRARSKLSASSEKLKMEVDDQNNSKSTANEDPKNYKMTEETKSDKSIERKKSEDFTHEMRDENSKKVMGDYKKSNSVLTTADFKLTVRKGSPLLNSSQASKENSESFNEPLLNQ